MWNCQQKRDNNMLHVHICGETSLSFANHRINRNKIQTHVLVWILQDYWWRLIWYNLQHEWWTSTLSELSCPLISPSGHISNSRLGADYCGGPPTISTLVVYSHELRPMTVILNVLFCVSLCICECLCVVVWKWVDSVWSLFCWVCWCFKWHRWQLFFFHFFFVCLVGMGFLFYR